MDLRQYFVEQQEGKLNNEQQALIDELHLIVTQKTQMTIGDLMESGLLLGEEDVKNRLAYFEVASFFISWMEMIIFNGLNLPPDRVRELEVVLLSVRLSFCLPMKDKAVLGQSDMEYWMDRMVGRCRRYWAQMDLKNLESAAKTSPMLLENLGDYLVKSCAIHEFVYHGLEKKVRNLVDMANLRLSRHGFKLQPPEKG